MALADSVVVLHAGRIEDQGPPQRVYLRPATPFTARFMGDSNVLEGRVIDGAAVVETALGQIPFTAGQADGAEGGQVAVCIRPEHLRPDADGPARLGEGRLLERHFVGTHQRWRVAAGGQELVLFVDPGLPWEADMAVPLSCDPANVILLGAPG